MTRLQPDHGLNIETQDGTPIRQYLLLILDQPLQLEYRPGIQVMALVDHFNLGDIKILLIDEVYFFFPTSEKQPGVSNFFLGKIFGSEN